MLRNSLRDTFILLTVFLLAPIVKAQDFKADLKKMNEAYGKMSRLYAEIDVNIYESQSSLKVIEKKRAVIKKNNNQFMYKLDDVTMLLNEKCVVMVYDETREIMYSKRQEKDEVNFKEMMQLPDIENAMKQMDSVVYNGTKGNLKSYTAYSSRSMIRKCELFINTQTGFLTKTVYYYNQTYFPVGGKVIVDYKNYDTTPAFSPSEFSESRFVVVSKKEVKPSVQYGSYEVLVADEDNF